MSSLPNSVNYSEVINSLPENTTKYSVALAPVNGSSFGLGGQQIQFQFNTRGFLDPQSTYLRYKLNITSSTTASAIFATPVYTPFQRLEVQVGSQTIDSINNFNQVANLLVNTTFSVADKYGMQSAYGWSVDGPTAGAINIPTLEQLDGRVIVTSATESVSMAAPLPCILSNCEKMLPLFAMPTITLILTTEALANMVSVVTTLSNISITNVELCYDFVDFGAEIEAVCRGMGPKVYIKSQSFSQSAVTIPSASSGSQSLIFNQRYASVKAAFVLFGGPAYNKLFDSVDITSNTGSYSLTVSGIQYPQKPLDAQNNKSGILQELRRCVGSLYDSKNSMSINTAEFNMTDLSNTITIDRPAKFYLGFNLEKYHGNTLLSGISTNNSNISVNIQQSNSTSTTRTCSLILGYDALIEIDMLNRQASVKV